MRNRLAEHPEIIDRHPGVAVLYLSSILVFAGGIGCAPFVLFESLPEFFGALIAAVCGGSGVYVILSHPGKVVGFLEHLEKVCDTPVASDKGDVSLDDALDALPPPPVPVDVARNVFGLARIADLHARGGKNSERSRELAATTFLGLVLPTPLVLIFAWYRLFKAFKVQGPENYKREVAGSKYGRCTAHKPIAESLSGPIHVKKHINTLEGGDRQTQTASDALLELADLNKQISYFKETHADCTTHPASPTSKFWIVMGSFLGLAVVLFILEQAFWQPPPNWPGNRVDFQQEGLLTGFKMIAGIFVFGIISATFLAACQRDRRKNFEWYQEMLGKRESLEALIRREGNIPPKIL